MASETEGAGAAAPAKRGYVKFSARLARVLCARIAAGETLRAVCADPDMPNRGTVTRWAREQPRFARIYHRAKAAGAPPEGLGPNTTYCPVTAHEICARLAEGESLTAICDDPAMPAMWTVMHWQRRSADFADALTLARRTQAERLADAGWAMALAATPETAILTSVRLAQLRWTAAIKSPRTHGRLKPSEPPAPPPQPQVLLFKYFHAERDEATGHMRMVTYVPDPATGRAVRTQEGPWQAPVDGAAKAADIERLSRERLARRAEASGRPAPSAKHDPEGWL